MQLHAEPSNVVFSITDDGPGVDPQRLRGGADIRVMGDRVEALGGKFAATAALGEGTTISGSVPVTK